MKLHKNGNIQNKHKTITTQKYFLVILFIPPFLPWKFYQRCFWVRWQQFVYVDNFLCNGMNFIFVYYGRKKEKTMILLNAMNKIQYLKMISRNILWYSNTYWYNYCPNIIFIWTSFYSVLCLQLILMILSKWGKVYPFVIYTSRRHFTHSIGLNQECFVSIQSQLNIVPSHAMNLYNVKSHRQGRYTVLGAW